MRDAARPFANSADAITVRCLRRTLAALFLILASLWLSVTPASAGTAHVFDSSFTPGGHPSSIAVDEQSGSVYVMSHPSFNEGGQEIRKFDLEGNPSNFSALGTNLLTASCTFERCMQVAVDNSGGPNQGVIYISSPAANAGARIVVYSPTGQAIGSFNNRGFPGTTPFCGVATDPSGAVYVTHSGANKNATIDKYKPDDWAIYPTQSPLIVQTLLEIDGGNQPCKVSADSKGRLYVIRGTSVTSVSALRLYEGVRTSRVVDASSAYSATDTTNDEVYSDHLTSIARLDKTGELIEEFGAGQLANSVGVTVDGETGTVFATDLADEKVKIFKAVPTPSVSVDIPKAKHESVYLSGHVEPGVGGNVTNCEFEVAQADQPYTTGVPCEPSTPFSSGQDVSAEVVGLQPGGIAHKFRLRATDANGTAYTTSGSFVTTRPATIDGLYTTNVTATTADLHAVVNPNGGETSYQFEYGPTTDYGSSAPIPAGTLPAELTGQHVSVHLTNLTPRTVYHFRIVAANVEGPTFSEDQTFNFFPEPCPNAAVRQLTGAEFLPDCRAYEIVSPEEAGNALISNIAIPGPYATNPPRFMYSAKLGALPGTNPPSAALVDFYVAERTARGWATKYVGLEGHLTPGSLMASASADFSTFATLNQPDTLGVTTTQPPDAPMYLWDAQNNPLGRVPDTASPTSPNAVPEANMTEGGYQSSPDFSHHAFSSNNIDFDPTGAGLTAAPGSAYDYEPDTQTTTLISRTAAGAPVGQENDIGQEPGNTSSGESIRFPGTWLGGPLDGLARWANPSTSSDGSHILMSTNSTPTPGSPVRLYMRVDHSVTYEVSRGGYVSYVGMTSDGDTVYFTSVEPLTADDHDTSEDLFMWRESGDALTRVSRGPELEPEVGDVDSCGTPWTSKCNVQVAPGGGEGTNTNFEFSADYPIARDSGDIYFYSPELLAGPEEGSPGAQNLFVFRNDAIHFVARLSSNGSGALSRMNVVPDGGYAAFVSKERLTTYENKSLAEMYRYEPATDRIVCVSCIPDGSSPESNVKGSTQGLFLTEDGRTFFGTNDALVSQDTDRLYSVYEYVNGRPQLISSGTSVFNSRNGGAGNNAATGELFGVSADGVNVYFSTYDTLVPQDHNGAFLKFYVARTGGGIPVPLENAPCEAADECHGEGSSAPSGAPISSDRDLGDSGNVQPGKKAKRKHSRARGKRQKQRHRKQHGRHSQRNHVKAGGVK